MEANMDKGFTYGRSEDTHAKREEAPPSYADSRDMRTVNDPQSDPAYGYDWNPPPQPAAPIHTSHNNVVVVQPGTVMPLPEPYVDVPDYFALSIVSIFFCLCLGIFSIVKASSARQMKASGRFQTARSEAITAKNTAIAGIILGLILTGLSIGLHLAAYNNSSH